MERTYTRINWENEPSILTPLNATNLNKIDSAVYTIDGRVVTQETTKANQSDLLQCVKQVDYNTTTGVMTFTWQNGTQYTIDLNIEKIPVTFSMDEHGVITMTTADGTQYTADVGALIKTYTFNDSSVIDFTVTTDASGNKTVTADIIDGSITGSKLEPNYLDNCQQAQSGAESAEASADADRLRSEGYAVGTQDGVPVQSGSEYYHNNAKYYSEQANPTSLVALTDVDINNPQNNESLVYNSTTGKWENKQGGTVIEELNDIGDVNITNPTNRQALVYDTPSGKWVNGAGTDETLSDTVNQNWQGNGYNLIPFPYYSGTSKTINGITYTVNEDGSVTVNGTATANCDFFLRSRTSENWVIDSGTYILSGCPNGGGANTYRISLGRTLNGAYSSIGNDFGNGFNFNPNSQYDHVQISVFIASGATVNNLTFKPMLVEVDSDGNYPTEYQRYGLGNIALTDEVSISEKNGYLQKNLVNTVLETSSKGGLTYTLNSDGSIRVVGSASGIVNIGLGSVLLKANESYILSGGVNENIRIDLRYNNTMYTQNTQSKEVISATREVGFTNNNADIKVVVNARASGVSNIDVTLYPMLRSANNSDSSYVPYAKSNTELNKDIEGISGGDAWLSTKAYSVNAYVIYQNKLYRCKAKTTAGILPTNTTYWEPISIKELNTNLVNKPSFCNYETYEQGIYYTEDGTYTTVNKPTRVYVMAQRDDVGYLRANLYVKNTPNGMQQGYPTCMYNSTTGSSAICTYADIPSGGQYKVVYCRGTINVILYPLM